MTRVTSLSLTTRLSIGRPDRAQKPVRVIAHKAYDSDPSRKRLRSVEPPSPKGWVGAQCQATPWLPTFNLEGRFRAST
jgi:hypothetical protein